jgi:hypothetical protein
MPELPELTLETPYGPLSVLPKNDTSVYLDHANVNGINVEGRDVVLAGWSLHHTEEGWQLLNHGALTYPDNGRHDPKLQTRLAGEIEVLFESWALDHQPELRVARQIDMIYKANRLEQSIADDERKLSESRARLVTLEAEIEAELGPELSALDIPPAVTAAEVPTRHDLGH